MDAFLEAILEKSALAKRDARTPWKTFYEAPPASGKVLSTPCTLASKGAADLTAAAHSARPELVNAKTGCFLMYYLFYLIALFLE